MYDHSNPSPGHNQTELTVTDDGAYDRSNPKSLINLLSPTIADCLIGTRNFLAHDLSDESIRKNISHMREYPMLQKLRQSFWLEHQRVLDADRARMEMTRIWQGICESSGAFYAIMKRPEFAAYVFTQPVAMEVKNHAMADLAWTRMMEIMGVSAIAADGKVNDKLARVQLEVWKHADERLQGGAVKRVAIDSVQKNLNHNLNENNVTITHRTDVASFSNPEEIRARIEELKKQIPDIDATATVVVEDSEE